VGAYVSCGLSKHEKLAINQIVEYGNLVIIKEKGCQIKT
jgi:hypothetical protein